MIYKKATAAPATTATTAAVIVAATAMVTAVTAVQTIKKLTHQKEKNYSKNYFLHHFNFTISI